MIGQCDFKVTVLAFCLLCIFSAFSIKEPLAKELSLQEAVLMAKSNSEALKANVATAESASFSADAAYGGLFPKLSLDGNYRRQSVVPEVTVGTKTIELTDSYSYSIGPTLTYTLWDSGLRRTQVSSLEEVSIAKAKQAVSTESQIVLATQIAYVQTALASESLDFAQRAAVSSETQNKDIHFRLKGGASSRLDSLNSDAEVSNYRIKVQQAMSDLKTAQADLRYLIGDFQTTDASVEGLADLLSRSSSDQSVNHGSFDPLSHPLIQAQSHLELAALSQAKSQRAGYWPNLNLQLRSSLDYPNGPAFEQIRQNTIALNFSWSLFEFGSTRNLVAAKSAEAMAAAHAKQDLEAGLKRDFEKAAAKIQGLRGQLKEGEVLVSKLEELAKLNYSTYRFGRLSYSEVQTSNLRLLETKIRVASLRAQLLVQLFNLQYLGEKE